MAAPLYYINPLFPSHRFEVPRDESILTFSSGAWAVHASRGVTLCCSGDAVVELHGTASPVAAIRASGDAFVHATNLGDVTVDAEHTACVFVHDSESVAVSAWGNATVCAIYVKKARRTVLGAAQVRVVLTPQCPC